MVFVCVRLDSYVTLGANTKWLRALPQEAKMNGCILTICINVKQFNQLSTLDDKTYLNNCFFRFTFMIHTHRKKNSYLCPCSHIIGGGN